MENVADVHSSFYSLLEQVTGTQWIGVTFLKYLMTDSKNFVSAPLRFCEAVFQARRSCIDVAPEVICCEGAKRSFGWVKNSDDALTLKLSEKTGLDMEGATQLIKQVPVLGYPYPGIRIGYCPNPDVLVTYVQPKAAMRLVRLWEAIMGHTLRVAISSIMAVCGNAVVRSYMNQSISLSFGCPDSRRYGGIGPDQLVVAIPTDLLREMKDIAAKSDALFGANRQ